MPSSLHVKEPCVWEKDQEPEVESLSHWISWYITVLKISRSVSINDPSLYSTITRHLNASKNVLLLIDKDEILNNHNVFSQHQNKASNGKQFKTIINTAEESARSCIKREKHHELEVELLSYWKHTLRSVVRNGINNLRSVSINDSHHYLMIMRHLNVHKHELRLLWLVNVLLSLIAVLLVMSSPDCARLCINGEKDQKPEVESLSHKPKSI